MKVKDHFKGWRRRKRLVAGFEGSLISYEVKRAGG